MPSHIQDYNLSSEIRQVDIILLKFSFDILKMSFNIHRVKIITQSKSSMENHSILVRFVFPRRIALGWLVKFPLGSSWIKKFLRSAMTILK